MLMTPGTRLATLYRMPETKDPENKPSPPRDFDSERSADAQRRSAGEAFDRRMEELTRDAPRPQRPDQDRRRRR